MYKKFWTELVSVTGRLLLDGFTLILLGLFLFLIGAKIAIDLPAAVEAVLWLVILPFGFGLLLNHSVISNIDSRVLKSANSYQKTLLYWTDGFRHMAMLMMGLIVSFAWFILMVQGYGSFSKYMSIVLIPIVEFSLFFGMLSVVLFHFVRVERMPKFLRAIVRTLFSNTRGF